MFRSAEPKSLRPELALSAPESVIEHELGTVVLIGELRHDQARLSNSRLMMVGGVMLSVHSSHTPVSR